MSIGIVNLNLGIDRVYAIPGFSAGNVYRSIPAIQAGGKGVNVARVLKVLGSSADLTGCTGGSRGRQIIKDLRCQGLRFCPFPVRGESRFCCIVVDTFHALHTVINEPGVQLQADKVVRLRRHIRSFLAHKDIAVFSGSVPPGIAPSVYGRMIGDAVALCRAVFVDIAGDHLRSAIERGPFLVKPNWEEWEALVGKRLHTNEAARRSVRFARERGAQWIVLSRGKDGFLAFHGDRYFDVRVPRIKVVNAVGSGDALVAGFTHAFEKQWSPRDAVRYAAAVASAQALTPLPGQVRRKDIELLVPRIRVREARYRG